MSQVRSMSIVVVSLSDDDTPSAYVSMQHDDNARTRLNLELTLNRVQPTEDLQDWSRQVAAMVCELL